MTLLDQARTELRHALSDLRDLARGIHPAVPEQVGLAAAVETVAESMPLPVVIATDAPARRRRRLGGVINEYRRAA